MEQTEKPYYIVTFNSTNDAMKAEKLLINIGSIIPIPSEISAGCGFSIKLEELSPGFDIIKDKTNYSGLYKVLGRGKNKVIEKISIN